jgi:hypothetical protein
MRMKGTIFLRISAWVIALIGALTIAMTAFTYSCSGNRETAKALAREFFVRLWKGSVNRATAKNMSPSATPDGRIIQ